MDCISGRIGCPMSGVAFGDMLVSESGESADKYQSGTTRIGPSQRVGYGRHPR